MVKAVEINPELSAQIEALSTAVHELLNGPESDGQLTGDMEMQRVVLEVPRAFVLLATFMATCEQKQNRANVFWRNVCDDGNKIHHRVAHRKMRRYLERVLYNAMQGELHWLVTHGFLPQEPLPDMQAGGADDDRDDEIPF